MLDLLAVWLQLRFGRKPMVFFGTTGAVLVLLGVAVGLYEIVQRYVYQQGNRAFLYLVLLLVIAGLVLFGFGFVGELVAGQREEIRALQREVDRLHEGEPRSAD